MIQTAGTWSRERWPVYFVAVAGSWFVTTARQSSHMLIAVNEMGSKRMVSQVRKAIDDGKQVLIDSGIFSLTQRHARANKVSMDEALALSPEDIDGFDELMEQYLGITRELGDDSWGYIELDQGGLHNKRKTRARLEGLGLRPIPVYHPLNDGWDYFDELAANYDRICFANVVQADPYTRRRLLLTAFERAARCPHLWVHVLGVTPTHWVSSLPLHSSDSSSWSGLYRYGSGYARCGADPIGAFGSDYALSRPRHGRDDTVKMTEFAASEAEFVSRNVFDLRQEYRREGFGEIDPGDLPPIRIPSMAGRP